jgi:2-C-methyl-D-erythritol 4-phosphate cytidylyltransferase
MIYAALVAGGTGSRMGADIPKQFLKICGKPIIIRTIECFLSNKNIDAVYIGVNSEWVEKLEKMCAEFNLDAERINIISGGADRNDTVFNIIRQIHKEHGVCSDDIILTHDGVRPFLTQKIIDENIGAMTSFDGVTTSLPSTDTMIISEDGRNITSVPERAKMFRAQTPQTFKLEKLISAYNSLSSEQKSKLTDTASIFTCAGLAVGLVSGDECNIKITTPFDIVLAETIINLKQL